MRHISHRLRRAISDPRHERSVKLEIRTTVRGRKTADVLRGFIRPIHQTITTDRIRMPINLSHSPFPKVSDRPPKPRRHIPQLINHPSPAAHKPISACLCVSPSPICNARVTYRVCAPASSIVTTEVIASQASHGCHPAFKTVVKTIRSIGTISRKHPCTCG